MPWTENRYPTSMQHLDTDARRKAIEIANALLRDGMDEGMCIRIAIARAKQWRQRHFADANMQRSGGHENS